MLKNIKHIFFDLDKTLWDFETNSTLTLIELFEKHDLASYGIPSLAEMIDIYKKINQKLWAEYAKNSISKETLRTERFKQTFEYFGVYNYDLAFRFGTDYVELSPRKNVLYPNTFETLDYLKEKYELHIITNGFEEVQYIKLQSSGILHYFKNIITSEKAGAKKPDKAIFDYALSVSNASTDNSIMVGDDLEVDIMGALNANIPAVHFLPQANNKISDDFITINSLSKLIEIL
jgi:putative hydrolase of the HAD superfamily